MYDNNDMRKRAFFLLPLLALSLTACEDFKEKIGIAMGDRTTLYHFEEMTGRWDLVDNQNQLSDVQSAYFVFNGTRKVMSVEYYENDVLVHKTTFKGVFNGKGDTNPLCLVLQDPNYDGSSKGDRDLWAYTEDKQEDLQQFTIVYQEYYHGLVRGMIDNYPYHLDNCPVAFGTYLKEGKTFKPYEEPQKPISYMLNGFFVNEESESYFYFLDSARDKMTHIGANFAYYQKGMEKPEYGHLMVYGGDTNTAGIWQEHTTYEPNPYEKGLGWLPAMKLTGFEYDYKAKTFSFSSVEEGEEKYNTFNTDPSIFGTGTYTFSETKPSF